MHYILSGLDILFSQIETGQKNEWLVIVQ